ncbi:MAG: CsbD family protein [Actinocatenispora sp.]
MGLDDKVENTKDEVAGKAKRKLGEATDNEQWEAEGKAQQDKGRVKQAGEKIKDVFRD